MGQKVNPKGLRLGINRTWDSIWFSDKHYVEWLHEDLKVKKYIRRSMSNAGISKVTIQRVGDKINLYINAARPGIVIGKKGQDIEKHKKHLEIMTGRKVFIYVKEVKTPELDAKLVAARIALQMKKRVGFRRAMKRALRDAQKHNVRGIKILVKGRLDGAEMSRQQRYIYGQVPLHTLKADIDYHLEESRTTYGTIGVKVWIYKGEKYQVHSRRDEEFSRNQRRRLSR